MKLDLQTPTETLELHMGGKTYEYEMDVSDEVIAWAVGEFQKEKIEIAEIRDRYADAIETPEAAEEVASVMSRVLSRMLGEQAAESILEALGGGSKGLTQIFKLWLNLSLLVAERSEATRDKRLEKYINQPR